MYAVIETGGKQYTVREGDELEVELVGAESSVEIQTVLLISDGKNPRVGAPYVPKCSVFADVLGEVKGDKVIAFKYKKRKNYRRTVGHRQRYSRIRITKIAAA